jgi:hypothetical protein
MLSMKFITSEPTYIVHGGGGGLLPPRCLALHMRTTTGLHVLRPMFLVIIYYGTWVCMHASYAVLKARASC